MLSTILPSIYSLLASFRDALFLNRYLFHKCFVHAPADTRSMQVETSLMLQLSMLLLLFLLEYLEKFGTLAVGTFIFLCLNSAFGYHMIKFK